MCSHTMPAQSIPNLQQALLTLPADSSRVVQLGKIATAFQAVNQDSANYYYHQAYQLATKIKHPFLQVDYLLKRGKLLLNMGYIAKADTLFQRALRLEQTNNRTEKLTLIYQNKGVILGRKDSIETAIEWLEKAEKIAIATDTPQQYLPGIYLDLGAVHFSNGTIDKSTAYIFKAIEQFKQAKKWEKIAIAFLNLAINNLEIEDYNKAETYALDGLEYAKKTKNKNYEAYAYKILTAVSSELGKQEIALRYAFTSLDHWQDLGNIYETGFSNRFIGKVLKNQGKTNQALTYLAASVEQFQQIKEEEQLIFSLVELGDGYIAVGRTVAGLQQLAAAETLLADQQNKLVHNQNVYKLLEDAYQKAQAFEKAYFYRVAHDVLKDSIVQKERLQQISELETRYEVKEKEAQLTLQAASLKQQRNLIISIGIIGLLLLGLTLLGFKIANQRKKVNSKLRQLDQTKSNFFANVSHELRTPLTLILAPLENVIKNSKNTTHQADLQLAHSNSQKLLNLVDEILDLSKLEDGKMQVQAKAVQLHPLLKRILFAFESLAKLRGIQLNFQTDLPVDLWLKLDVSKAEKIVNNLISNALKYSSNGDKITFSVSKDASNKLLISVSDTGKGIPKADLSKVFNRFYQSEQNGQQLQGGTGIGLALAKEYAQLLNGDLTVESEVDKGTTFSLKLPLEKTEPSPNLRPLSTEKVQTLVDENTIFQPQVLFADQPKILVVEDNPEMSQFLVKTLSPYYRCTTALNGLEGLEKLQKDRFDLITSDVMMPEMDGFTFLQKVHERELFSHTPVIMLTARSLEVDKLQGLQLGVDDYITKPFNTNELLARIDNLLKNKKEREEWQKAVNQAVATESSPLTAEQTLLKKAELLIIEHIANSHFKVGDLAKKLNYSQRQLERIIKKLTGLSPLNFIKEIRLQQARQLLESRQFSTVAEVGYEVGFADPGYFSKVYQRRFGKRPSEV